MYAAELVNRNVSLKSGDSIPMVLLETRRNNWADKSEFQFDNMRQVVDKSLKGNMERNSNGIR